MAHRACICYRSIFSTHDCMHAKWQGMLGHGVAKKRPPKPATSMCDTHTCLGKNALECSWFFICKNHCKIWSGINQTPPGTFIIFCQPCVEKCSNCGWGESNSVVASHPLEKCRRQLPVGHSKACPWRERRRLFCNPGDARGKCQDPS